MTRPQAATLGRARPNRESPLEGSTRLFAEPIAEEIELIAEETEPVAEEIQPIAEETAPIEEETERERAIADPDCLLRARR